MDINEVLYRKWRPQRLDQVVGQEAVVQTLRNAVALNRVAHAYLFCGPRGTGKTSTARILAKAVNCLSPMGSEPDNKCGVCRSINEFRSMDLIEIDAASNRGIDDIRELRDKVRFAPSEARHKVYIIDEVHMLTEYAFNALLKTLEEPPPQVIFVLATTEVHKVPLTIVSRCQRFDFRRISAEAAVTRLAELCSSEGMDVETGALELITRASAGSLRDAENLLEQAIVSYGISVTEDNLRNLLELSSDESALELVTHMLNGSIREGLKVINTVANQGSDLRQFHRDVMEHFRNVLLFKSEIGSPLGYSVEDQTRIKAIAEQTSLEHIVSALKTYSKADIPKDGSTPLPLELALVESCLGANTDVSQDSPELKPTCSTGQKNTLEAPSIGQSIKTHPDLNEDNAPQMTDPVKSPIQEPNNLAPSALHKLETHWNEILNSLRLHKGRRFNLGALLRDCKEREVADGLITLKFSHRSHMERMMEEMENPQSRKIIRETIQSTLNGTYEIKISAVEGQSKGPKQNSPLVRTALAMGAQVVAEKKEKNE